MLPRSRASWAVEQLLDELGEAVTGAPVGPTRAVGGGLAVQWTELGVVIYSRGADRGFFVRRGVGEAVADR